jgi:hypothetical protein
MEGQKKNTATNRYNTSRISTLTILEKKKIELLLNQMEQGKPDTTTTPEQCSHTQKCQR